MENRETRFDLEWLRIHNGQVFDRLGRIRHVLFDFDGTLSVLRQGWEEVMIPMMVEAICGSQTQNSTVVEEVTEYVDRSTGILTIRQMQWLAEAVQRHGLAGEVRTAGEYKSLYLRRLMVYVRERMARMAEGKATPADFMIVGAVDFLTGLKERGVCLYLASGTDHIDVVREVEALGLLPYFDVRVYGALDGNEDHAKERVIQRILEENDLAGESLLVVGDGPVEIREGAQRGALTVGLASNEIQRTGWNPRKERRLITAGADLLVPDFRRTDDLLRLLFQPETARNVEKG